MSLETLLGKKPTRRDILKVGTLGVAGLFLAACESNPILRTALASVKPTPDITPAVTPIPSEPPTLAPTVAPETTTSPEAQAQLEKAFKEWLGLDGATKTPLPEPFTVAGHKVPFHITEGADQINANAQEPGQAAAYEIVLLGEQVTSDGHAILYGGIQNEDTAKTRHVIAFNMGLTSNIMSINTISTYTEPRTMPHTNMSVSSALDTLKPYIGKTIEMLPIITAVAVTDDASVEINAGVATSLAIARWQENTAWPGSKETPPPANAGIDTIVTTFDASRLSPAQAVMIVTS